MPQRSRSSRQRPRACLSLQAAIGARGKQDGRPASLRLHPQFPLLLAFLACAFFLTRFLPSFCP